MTDCEMMAASYRKMVADGKLKEEDSRMKIDVYEFLNGKIEDGVIYNLIDTGYFNELIKSYIRGAMERAGAGVDDNTKNAIYCELMDMFDTMTAKEVYGRY
jgi:hypothetical protein